jgi:hypothetical protein
MVEGTCPGKACPSRCPAVAATRRRWYAKWQLCRSLHARDGRARCLGGSSMEATSAAGSGEGERHVVWLATRPRVTASGGEVPRVRVVRERLEASSY